MAEPVVVTLEDPITNEAGDEITEIKLRSPNLGDRQFLDMIMKIDAANGQAIIDNWSSIAFTAAQRLGDLSPATASKIGSADAQTIFGAVMGFIGGSRTTGLMESLLSQGLSAGNLTQSGG